ncbi:unnamed protein product [Effrenium voratum]|nr:unnamed protein product [Effrenium voratum]
MASLADQRCFLPLDLAFSFLAWRDLVPASAVSPAFLRAQAGALCCCSLAGPVTALPCSDGALRWLARRAACGVSPGVEFLKISATACRHTDAGALAVSTVCEPLRVLHFHSKVALRESSATLSPRGLQALLGSGRPALLRAVLHGDAVTDAALEILSAGSPLLQALWLSCSAQVSAGAVRKLAISALQLQDLRLDSLRSAFAGDFKEVLAMPRLQCVLVADAVQLPPVLSASDVQRWQAMRRLAILIEAGCPICPSRPLDHWAAEALGQLPCLESLALANVCVGDHLLQALHGSVTLCALSLEGDHGATLPGICGLLRARGRAGAGLLEELQLTAGWGDTRLPSGQPLWSIDKEGCCVWMGGLGGLAHDVLKHFLASTKGQFEAVVAFSPTGWTWTKAMAQNACAGCRCWMENEGRTRVYSVPYSEHSSYEELLALVNGLRPKRLIPTVNSETRESKERMMAPFLELLDLKGDRERMDHYLYGSSSSSCKLEAEDSFVDVLSLSTACKAEVLRTPSAPSKPAPKLWRGFRLARQPRPKAVDLDSEDSTTAGGSSSSSPKATCPAPSQLSGALAKRRLVVDLDSEEAAPAPSAGASAAESPAAEELPTALDDLRCVDLDLQKRLLRFFESAKAPEAPKAGLKKPKQPKSKGKGKGKSKSESQAPVLKHLGVRPKEEPKPKKRRAAKPSARTGREKRTKTESTAADPKQPGEKRPARFVPKPSARVQERIDRAFGHRLYFLARAPAEGGEKLDVLGSTGNVYHVELRSQGNACSCLDFAKGGGVCKHLLFVMLRVLKLARDDHRVWQSGLTESVDDAVLLCFVRLGITYLTLEGANISKDGIRRCAGLQALRAKSCGELDLLPPVARLGPPPRKKKPGPFAAKALKAKTDGGLASGWDVRLLGSDQQLCHWWQKGYRYDDMSWYGLEHA